MSELTATPSPMKQQNIPLQELKNLFQHAPVGIVIYSGPTFIVEFANDLVLNILGKKIEEVKGKAIRDIFPEINAQEYIKALHDASVTKFLKGETFTVNEVELTFKRNGEIYTGWFSYTHEPIKDEDGNLTGIIAIAHEVTDQVLARKKIEESEERFRTLATEFPLFVWLTDEKLQTTFLNKTGRDYFNLSDTTELADLSWKKFIHPDDLEKVLSVMNESANKHESYTLKMRLRNGTTDEYRWFLDNGMPQYSNNKFTGFIGTSMDIHEQELAEELKLERKNEELNEAQQIAQLGSWDLNISTNEVSWSDQMYHIYGYDEKIPVDFNKAIERMLPEEAQKIGKRIIKYIAEAERAFREEGVTEYNNPAFEYMIVLPDGSKKILRGAGKIVVGADGKASRMIGTVQDITNQKLIEQELINTNKKLAEHNEFISKLINSSLDVIIVVDKELRFITVNEKARTVIHPFYEGELIGKKITEVNPSLEGTGTFNDLLKAFEGEIIIRDKVKSTISDNYYEHNYVPLQNTLGEIYAVMMISHDITENIRQMEELRKLNESDKLKSDFIKMASHELKTPVTSIKGHVQLLLAALKKEEEKTISPELMRSALASIDKQIGRLTRLMAELLDLSKIEIGKLDLNKELFSINELVIETVQDILYSHSKHKIRISHDFECRVYADKDRIGQALTNFLINAIKYSPDSDIIEVVICKEKRNNVSVSVKDHGIGIDKKYHEKIFERFFRAEDKEEQTYPGFGIGLFIAKEIIQQHDGTIHLVSEKNKGSVFTFSIPTI